MHLAGGTLSAQNSGLSRSAVKADSKSSAAPHAQPAAPAATLHRQPGCRRVSLARRRRRRGQPHRGRGSLSRTRRAAPKARATTMARLTDGDDMLTFWSRAQYMRREVEPDVTELQAHTSQLYPPSFWLTKKQAQRRWASSMTSADRAAYEKRRNSHRQFVSPMRRRGEAVMNSPNKPTSILSRSHTPKTSKACNRITIEFPGATNLQNGLLNRFHQNRLPNTF